MILAAKVQKKDEKGKMGHEKYEKSCNFARKFAKG
jgi:hypothetical protein